MSKCICPIDLESMQQLCDSCTAEYLKQLDEEAAERDRERQAMPLRGIAASGQAHAIQAERKAA